MVDTEFVPCVGTPLSGPGLETVIEAVKRRQTNFPDEPLEMTLALILLNIGDRWTPLECTGKEWRGFKKDLHPLGFPASGKITCPNGHEIEKGQGITLGWVFNS